MKLNVLLVSICFFLIGAFSVWSGGRSETIFEIGVQDNSYNEFKLEGFKEIEEFILNCGENYATGDFPYGHFAPEIISNRGVQSIVIQFETEEDYSKGILLLSREGSETTRVLIDEDAEYRITSEMLGSRDGNHFGSYELDIGAIPAGKHSIRLTVDDDGKSIGGYAWDAIRR